MNARCFEIIIVEPTKRSVCDILAEETGLPKLRIKRAVNCGAAWIQKPGGKKRRIRRVKTSVHCKDRLSLYYDPAVLALEAPDGICLNDLISYSTWYKPAGLMSQGTRYGDHCSLLRQVEKHFTPKRKAFPVHRLDREAAGVMVVAHTAEAAARLSVLFQRRQVDKRYQIQVRGDLTSYSRAGSIDTSLDGKEARTEFEVIRYDRGLNQSTVKVRLQTGRRHQIRRHFSGIGFPLIGDPRYGSGNKDKKGLRLVAYALAFRCPFTGEWIESALDLDKETQ